MQSLTPRAYRMCVPSANAFNLEHGEPLRLFALQPAHHSFHVGARLAFDDGSTLAHFNHVRIDAAHLLHEQVSFGIQLAVQTYLQRS